MANAKQRIYFGSEASPVAQSELVSGSFRFVGFSADVSDYIDYDDNETTVVAAIEYFSAVGVGDVGVTDPDGNGFLLEFQGALANTPVNALEPSSNTLLQNADTVSLTTTTDGQAGDYESHTVNHGMATTGTYEISWDGGTTTYPIDPFDDPAADAQAAYNAHFGSGAWSVTGTEWTATAAAFGQNSALPTIHNDTTDGSGVSASYVSTGADESFQVVSVTLTDNPTAGSLMVSLDGVSSSTFAHNAGSPGSITGWTGGGSAGNWTYTRNTAAANVSAGHEIVTPLTKECDVEVVVVDPGSYALTADSITAGAPTVGSPTLTETGGSGHSLTANSISSGTPTVGTPAITQVHVLAASNVSSGTPSVGAPAITQKHVLSASGVATGAPSVGAPTIAQVHALAAAHVASGSPTTGSPTLTQRHAITATSVSSGTPTVGSPSLAQANVLAALGVSSGTPTVGSPAIGQVHVLVGASISSGTPSVGSPSLGQVHVLLAGGVSSGTPAVGSPSLGQVHALTAGGVSAGTPSVGSPTLAESHSLSAVGVSTGTPTVGSPVLRQIHALVAASIASGAPTVGSPVLTLPDAPYTDVGITFTAQGRLHYTANGGQMHYTATERLHYTAEER